MYGAHVFCAHNKVSLPFIVHVVWKIMMQSLSKPHKQVLVLGKCCHHGTLPGPQDSFLMTYMYSCIFRLSLCGGMDKYLTV